MANKNRKPMGDRIRTMLTDIAGPGHDKRSSLALSRRTRAAEVTTPTMLAARRARAPGLIGVIHRRVLSQRLAAPLLTG
jgi:hypothetical protein